MFRINQVKDSQVRTELTVALGDLLLAHQDELREQTVIQGYQGIDHKKVLEALTMTVPNA